MYKNGLKFILEVTVKIISCHMLDVQFIKYAERKISWFTGPMVLVIGLPVSYKLQVILN